MSGKIIDIPVQKTRIANLTPNEQNFTLTFEITEIISQTNDTLRCRIVDDSGIINAVFTKYINRYAISNVYLIRSSPRNSYDVAMSQLRDDTTVERIPFKLGFKDKVNDMSLKYYATKKELEQIQQTKKQAASKIETTNDPNISPSKRQIKSTDKRQKIINGYMQKQQEQQKQQKIQSKKSVSFIQPKDKKPKNKVEQPHTQPQNKIKRQKKYKQTKQQKKYVEKKTSWTKIKVAASKNHEEHVNVIAFITKKSIQPDNGNRYQIADDSGSIWTEFNRFEPQQGQIYEFDNMMVCKLKKQDGKIYQTILKEVQISEVNAYMQQDKFTHNLQPVGDKQQE